MVQGEASAPTNDASARREEVERGRREDAFLSAEEKGTGAL